MRVQDEFQGLLYYVFMIEKKYRVDKVAETIGCAPSTIYDFAEGRRALPAAFLSRLFKATRDIRFLDVVVAPCGMACAPIPDDGDPAAAEALTGHLANTMLEIGHVTEEVLAALRDGKITRAEAKRIRTEIHHAQTALATLAAALPSEVA